MHDVGEMGKNSLQNVHAMLSLIIVGFYITLSYSGTVREHHTGNYAALDSADLLASTLEM